MAVAMELDRDPLAKLERQWTKATVAAARAQRAYQDLQVSADADEKVEARVWLRLWKAERRKCEVLAAMDALDR
jgi:hypothetical protein